MTDPIGSVAELWRYPVKSMMGERLESAEVTTAGVLGDRGWAARDEVRGGIRGAKKIGSLMALAARYVEEPTAALATPVVEITLPDGDIVRTDDPDANARVSKALDHEVTLWPLQPADQLDHYRRGAPDNDDFLTEMRQVFGRLDDEPLPDPTGFPPEIIVEYESPPGTYFDAFPLMLATTSSLAEIQQRVPDSLVDVRRFRPNFLIDTGSAAGFVEQTWLGRRLRVGGVEAEVVLGCPRCVMVTRGFADLPEDRAILRTVVREANQNLGVYANVVTPGRVSPGDPVELLD